MNRILELLNHFLPPSTHKWLLISIGLILMIFNDELGRADKDLFVFSLALYFLLLVFLLLRWLFKQSRGNINLKKEQKNMELLHLQSQVNPHFFFNMLNNLYGWVDKDPKVAQSLILKLSDMMRYSIYDGQKSFVTIREEVEYLQNYIELNRSRYNKRIDVQFDVQIDDPNTSVMPLLFIILLENAFKHGVENLRDNAFVHMNLSTQEDTVRFTIENSFDPSIQNKEKGIGIQNLERRLELVYPGKHELKFNTKDDVYSADLMIML